MTWRHPEWWVVAVVAAAWAGLALAEVAGGWGVVDHHHNTVTGGTGQDRTLDVAWMVLMATAMMAPLALPSLRHLSLTSLWSHRYRVQALFLAGYLMTWVVAAAAITSAVMAVQIGLGRVVAMGSIFSAAALWQFAPAKRRALRRCSRMVPIAARGWRADRDRAHFGAISAASCVITCWGFMAALAAMGHGFGAMSALFVIQLHERIAPRYVPIAGAALVCSLGIWNLATGLIASHPLATP